MKEQQYQSLLKKMPSGFALHEIICNESGTPINFRFLETNPAFEKIFGFGKESMVGKTVLDIYPEIKSHWIEIFGKVALEGVPAEFESYAVSVQKHFSITAYSPSKGQFVSIFHDITERKKTEEALKHSEKRFRDIVDCSMEWVWEVDENMQYTYTSSAYGEMLGYKAEEIIGKNPFDFMSPEEAARIEHLITPIIEARQPFSRLENTNIHKDGRQIIMISSGVPIFTSSGSFAGYRGVDLDITEYKNVENQLKDTAGALTESEDRFRSLQEFFPTAIGFHENGHFIDANNALIQLFGYTVEELRAHQGLELIAEESQGIVRDNISRGFDGVYSVIGQRKDGRKFPLEVQGRSVPFKGRVLRITEFRDLTEREKTDAKLRQSQKLEALGHLTGGIAHDFNNILGIVQGNLELLKRKIPDNADALERLEKAHNGTIRAAKLTEKLLGFSRQEAHGRKLTSINEFIQNMEELISRSLTVSIKVDTHLANDLWTVNIDTGDLEDAILNLSLNARDAMPDGGTLVIETANKTLDANYAIRNESGKAGDFVMISVSDTGIGMPKEVKEKVFEPFFTTKEESKGTGLGLSMVYGFVQRSGGHIKIYSEIGKGTTFRLYIPRANNREIEQEKTTNSQLDPPRGNETILVVDDERALADVAFSHLHDLGYKVLTAYDGREALQILEQTATIDLIFSDIIMPGGIDGYQLAKAVHDKYPEIRVLLTSGFTNNREEKINQNDRFLSTLAANLLNKPYNKIELATHLRQVLDNA